MGQQQTLITALHTSTKRPYLQRMLDEKVTCMGIAKKYGQEFWDGDRRFGYGGYRYDGRYASMAQQLIDTYHLGPKARILDIGCGKGFILYELKKLLPSCEVVGFDISAYALANAKEEMKPYLFEQDAAKPLPFSDGQFDFAFSITTLHNLHIKDLCVALSEMNRVAKQKYLVVESYRNDQELFNLQCWALTCASFYQTEDWIWLLNQYGYTGDYEFIYFE